MKNRSQSERGLDTKGRLLGLKYKSPQKIGAIQQNDKLVGQLSNLQHKIQVSKPILQDIYNKLHKKQKFYQQAISKQVNKGQKIGQLAHQYRRLYGQGLKIIGRNNLQVANKFTSYRNFNILPSQIQQQKQRLANNKISHSQSVSVFQKPNIIESHDSNLSFASRYKNDGLQKQNKNLSNAVSAKNIYQKYRRKIGEQMSQNETTLNKVRRLSKEIDRDISQLKLNKNRSTVNLKLNKYSCLPLSKQTKDKKTYFLQLQKRKLRNI